MLYSWPPSQEEVGAVIFPILQTGSSRPREVKELVWGHEALGHKALGHTKPQCRTTLEFLQPNLKLLDFLWHFVSLS